MGNRRKRDAEAKPVVEGRLREAGRQPIIFVVDDDPSVREGLANLIRVTGWRVETFVSATEFLKRGPPDGPCCLILDLALPGLSGIDLQRELVSVGRRLPIIFITGHGDIATTVRAMKTGVVDFLTKPFIGQDLLQSIKQAIEKDRLEISGGSS